MNNRLRKYLTSVIAVAAVGHMVFGSPLSRLQDPPAEQQPELNIVVPPPGIDTTGINLNAPSAIINPGAIPEFPSTDVNVPLPPVDSQLTYDEQGNLIERTAPDIEHAGIIPTMRDSLGNVVEIPDSIFVADSIPVDTTARRRGENKSFLDDEITGNNKDSLVYDVRQKMVYIYTEGDVTYQDMNLKADYMEISLDTKNIYAFGVSDSLGNKTRPEFTQGGSVYTMDTITYNIDTEKAKIKGVATQEGDGFLIARNLKKMPDNTANVADGMYTTCDHLDHPHFYLAMTKAKLIPGKKVIVGPSYLVLEDVPIYFPLLPFGFFPVTSGRSSGILIPSYGEESRKGFFLRDGGYYFAPNDYIDATVLAGIYTQGSWEASVSSRYIKRYKFSGGLNFRYTKNIIGERGDDDYQNSSQFSLQWTHTQDPKFKPNTSFSASVNFSSSGYNKYGATTVNDYLNTQTSSSIAYSKSWPGKPFNFSTNLAHSQNSRDSTYSFTFPSMVFNVQRLYPFKRKMRVGKERWYEKISMQYTGNLTNSVQNVKEYDLFKDEMFKQMKTGVYHTIPVSTSFNLFTYLNLSPSFNYQERWYFRKVEREWDPTINEVVADTTYGFYRLYNYSMSASMSTKIYGEFTFTGKDPVVKAIRHVMTPTASINYTPDFGHSKFGYWKYYQYDANGTIQRYSPYSDGPYGVPGSGQSANISFGLQNTLEMKVRSERDTSGVKKLKLIDNLSFNGSYDLMKDTMNLSTISANLRSSIIKNFAININAIFDPYQFENGTRVNKFMISKGSLARLTSASTSFSYSFQSSRSGQAAINDINSGGLPTQEQTDFFANNNITDPNLRRMMMTSQYYDFDIPWNLGFSYSLNYSNPGDRKKVTQTLSYNGSITPTPKWGVTFNGGYDFQQKKMTVGTITVTRDLHCWQMNFSWVPIGQIKSWSFNISVKSSVLRDLKYDRRSSRYDSIYYE